ncbi:6605_t:CDS:2 [Entrophospora sp. SA101]|nr:11948_t:CDS:2 [Entrophospora sp. SA101]CAJ0856416.1 6605_t:CDS:2 [Entrophospora sp. SA101]
MKKNDGTDYTSTSVNACLTAINRHIVEKSADSLTDKEINLILSHSCTSPSKWIWLNQQRLAGGAAEKLIIPYVEEIIGDYELYLQKIPLNAETAFYLHPLNLKDYNNKNIKHLISCYLQVTNNNGNTEYLDHGSQTSFNQRDIKR